LSANIGKIYSLTQVESTKILNKKDMFKKYVIGKKVKFKIDLIMLTTFGTKRNNYYNSLNINRDIKLSDMID